MVNKTEIKLTLLQFQENVIGLFRNKHNLELESVIAYDGLTIVTAKVDSLFGFQQTFHTDDSSMGEFKLFPNGMNLRDMVEDDKLNNFIGDLK